MVDQQFAELAELAGGFIHDLKNHLSTLQLNLQLLGEDFQEPQSPRERRALERINRLQSECERLKDVSNDFLRFARLKELDLVTTGLPGVIEELIDLFWGTAKAANIEMKSFLPADLPAVQVDRDLFKEALLNLMINAQHAMPNGGEITFLASREGDGVRLEVIDNGTGMPPEVVARAFRPFFSTRSDGTGLGLPTTKRIIAAHGGTIELQSEVGHGTKFTIRLPAAPPGLPAALPEPPP
jgi:signal transduction histidine kinase